MPVRLAAQEEPLPGYRLIDRLGRGGFGEVWKCEAPGGLHKAIKFVFGDLESQDEDSTRAAEQELKAMERVKNIRHPYILNLEQYHVIDGQLIIVMELADRNLWDRFRECRGLGMPGIPRDELMKYMEEAAEALDLMNNHYNIQHLDVKPQNLFLVFNHVKVADFGLAKTLEGIMTTITGGVTPVYAAPETFEGKVSRYTDQYSLAIVFQELLTGTRPFNGSNTKQLLMQHLNGTPDTEALSPADRAVIERGLAKKPDQRFPSCTELVKALKHATVAATVPAAVGATTQADSVVVTRAANLLGGDTPASRSHVVPPTPLPSGFRPPARPSGPQSPPNRRPGEGSGATPMPSLVTPRLVTPQAANAGLPAPANTLTRAGVVQTARMSDLGLAAAERAENGVLIPALIVAVGQTGLTALRAFQAAVRDRFGSTEAVPHIRYLYIDTDPAVGEETDPTLAAERVVARLNRPHHYLNREGLPSVEGWLPPGLLYNLPRNPEPAGGVRAYGRLALMDNYRLIAQRVKQQVEVFVNDDALDKAAATTELGVRSNRARVYLLAGLAGGTGGGMFLDLAYLLKNEFRQVGYGRPEVHGVLFVPPADKTAPRGVPLANTYAALTELAHFSTGQDRYRVRFDAREPDVTDAGPPFTRTTVYQLPKRPDPAEQAKVAELAVRRMFLDLFTPAGRSLDRLRPAADPTTPTVSAVGLARLVWPRRELLSTVARRLTQKLIARWTAKDTAHLRESLTGWLDDQWLKRGLEMEGVVGRFDQAAQKALNENPERVFDAYINPLAHAGGGRADPQATVQVLDQLLKLVGKPPVENGEPGSLHAPLMATAKEVQTEADGHFAALTVSLIEQTQYRLAGAEEALAQLSDRVTRMVDGLTEVRKGLDREVKELYSRLFPLIGGLSAGGFGSRKTALTTELLDALRQYPKMRLRLMVLDGTLDVYRGMLANVPDYLRDVNMCRKRLTDMGAGLTASRPTSPAAGRYILGDGGTGLDGLADQFLASVTPQDIVGFDQDVQKKVLRKCRGMVNVCLKEKHTAAFQELLLSLAREFLDSRLERSDPATVFLRNRPAGADTTKFLAETVAAATPGLTTQSGQTPAEVVVLACPTGADGERFRALVETAVPDLAVLPASLPDDIAVVREYPQVPVADLPQTGPHAREAFEAQLKSDRPPHTRVDVTW